MNSLESIRAAAKRDANARGRRLVILNLNRFAPLYVIRDSEGMPADCDSFVEFVDPDSEAPA